MKWRTLAGLLCAALAVALGLLAADVSSWRSAFMRDDIRFRALPRHHDLWQPSTILPGDPASALLGTSSSVRWREALQSFAATQTLTGVQSATKGPALRASAQQRLLTQLAAAPTKSQRSQAANLLGVLVVTTPSIANDPSAITQTLTRSAEYFQEAIALDPSNNDAKENLELVLRLTKPGKGKIGNDARSGYGFGKGQGIGNQGGGY